MPADGQLSSPPPAAGAIPFRRMRFELAADVPARWVGGSQFLTQFYNALSAVFPEGEKFFVKSVRHFEARVDDPALQVQIRGFVAQEGHHTFQHRQLNAVVEGQGLDIARWDRFIRAYLALVWRSLGPRGSLGVTCALEHYTAIMGHQLLSDPRQRAPLHPTMLPLWVWHAVEETEHKAVAFDVYRRVGGGYLGRVLTQLLASASFLPIVHYIQLRLMLADRGARMSARDVLRGLWFLYGKPGGLRRMLPELCAYFRPGFHPWQHDNRALVERWKTSPEAQQHHVDA